MTTEALDEPEPTLDLKSGTDSNAVLAEGLRRAMQGDERVLPAIRTLFDAVPPSGRLIEQFGSPADWLESRMIERSAGKNLVIREAMERKLAGLRAELAGPSPSPLERLLVERAVLCWLTVHLYEHRQANVGEQTLRQAEFFDRRIDRAHSRFLSAVKTLAMVRKLALPALRVTVGPDQVNVA